MNNATYNTIGNNHNSQTAKATTITPSTKRVYGLDAKTKRCKRNTKRQTQVSTDFNATNGFLKCKFLPKLEEIKSLQVCKESKKMERDFYLSLSKLIKHYNIEIVQTLDFTYPYNITLAMWDIEEKLQQKVFNWEEIQLVQDSKRTYFVSEERCNTNATLFYIPIAPLYRMLHDKNRKRNAHLLVSVCTYLYHIVDIPYYRQETSYLYWMYEMITDWIEEDDYTEETENYLSEIKQMEYIGDCIEQKIYNHTNLTVFEKRINSFKVKDNFDAECLAISKEALFLYQNYPNQTIFRNAKLNEEFSEDEFENYITMDKYISFYADYKGWFSDSLIDMVNSEMQECSQIEEPCIQKKFDGSSIDSNNLCFENHLFELLNKLCNLLNRF